MVAAAGRATRPMDRNGLAVRTQPLLERRRSLHGPSFGIDLSDVAIIGTCTGDHPSEETRRIRRQFFKQRLVKQSIEMVLGHIDENRVLSGCKPNLPLSVNVGKPRKLAQRLVTDSSDIDAQPNGIETGLLLLMNAKVIIVPVGTRIRALGQRLPAEPVHKFLAKTLQSPVFQKECKAAFCPRATLSFIAKELDHLHDDVVCLIRLDKPSEIGGNGEPAGAHLSSRQDMES